MAESVSTYISSLLYIYVNVNLFCLHKTMTWSKQKMKKFLWDNQICSQEYHETVRLAKPGG